MTEETEPVFDRYGCRVPDTVRSTLKYRMAQKLATAPKVDTATGRPLPYAAQPDAVRRAQPQAGREEAVRRVGAALGIDPAVMLSNQPLMARLETVDPDDVPAMTHAISDGITADPSLIATAI